MTREKFLSGVRPYVYLIPIIFLFALGILFKSAVKVESNACGCDPLSQSGKIDTTATSGEFNGGEVRVPEAALAYFPYDNKVLGVATPEEKWIEVDLSEQRLRAWDGDKLFTETLVSTGLPGTPTPTGEYRVWMKIRATRMNGGEGRLAYDLPNVPYVMFFSNDKVPNYRGYGLHGTYWHNDFGKVHSHGCVNLPTPVAKILYSWVTPILTDNQTMVRTSADNPGTRIVIHE